MLKTRKYRAATGKMQLYPLYPRSSGSMPLRGRGREGIRRLVDPPQLCGTNSNIKPHFGSNYLTQRLVVLCVPKAAKPPLSALMTSFCMMHI